MNNRILVIDDNAAIHEDIRKILARPKPASGSFEDEEALLFGESNAIPNSASDSRKRFFEKRQYHLSLQWYGVAGK